MSNDEIERGALWSGMSVEQFQEALDSVTRAYGKAAQSTAELAETVKVNAERMFGPGSEWDRYLSDTPKTERPGV